MAVEQRRDSGSAGGGDGDGVGGDDFGAKKEAPHPTVLEGGNE